MFQKQSTGRSQLHFFCAADKKRLSQLASNVLIDWLTADWEINSFLLASENERELAT